MTPLTGKEGSAPQLYMQIQPDWSAPEVESCWVDVYERTVQPASTSEGSSLDQEERQTVRIESRASEQYQLPVAPAATQQSASASPPSASHRVEIVAREDSWIDVRANVCESTDSQTGVRTVFQAPTESFDVPVAVSSSATTDSPRSTQVQQLHTLDVSKDERYVAVGGSDGVCMLWDSEQRTQMLPLVGHVADVTCTKFFPSSQVLLTGALDFTLRIWSVRGRCAAVLRGHLGGVEDAAIVGKGRNVLSCGSDGLIQLWSCGSQDVIAKWANDDHSAVHCLAVLDDSTAQLLSDETDAKPADNEAETEGKVLFAGLDNGEILGVDVRARTAVLNVEGLGGAITSCACTAADTAFPLLLTGSEDGLFTTWDLRNTSAPLHVLSRSSSPIHDIVVSSSGNGTSSVWTAHGDGVCCNWSGLGDAPHVSTELTGPLYDAVRGVALAPLTGRVFTACRDGRLREYIPHVVD